MNNVIFIGLVSFFMDLSTEMVYPLIPLYLTAAFGTTPALIGVIEGIAESLASVLKVFSGYVTDRYRRKKPLAFSGYATGFVYKILLILATSWVGILAARAIDRFGKGIRTAPRDVLVSESARADRLGHSFGIHKALDMAGSAAGILVAWVLVSRLGTSANYKAIFLYSCVPAVFALLMFAFIRETSSPAPANARVNLLTGLSRIDGRLKLYLLVVFVFTLGNSSNAFLLLKAQKIGFSPSSVILLYFVYNAVSSLLSIPFGRLSDRVGRKALLVSGYLTFAAVYCLFAFAHSAILIAAAFALYGFFTALTAGVERAFIAEIAPSELKGTMLGLHSTVTGIALLPASVIAGFLWTSFNDAVPFALGASLSACAAVTLAIFLRPRGK
jgi:MFS family permease